MLSSHIIQSIRTKNTPARSDEGVYLCIFDYELQSET